MVIGLCSLPASLIVGLLWESFGMFAPLYFPPLPDPDPFLASSFRHKTIELLLNLTNLLIKNYNLHQGEKPKKTKYETRSKEMVETCTIRKILAFLDTYLSPVR